MEFLDRLRTETRHIHEEIERSSLFSRIINNSITFSEYCNLMRILYGFIAPRETIIQEKYPDFLIGREKTSLLKFDLLKMGVDFGQNDYQSNNIEPLNSPPEVFGYLYVIEGATLGGQIIKKCLLKNKNLNHPISAQYFNPYEENTEKNWMMFLRMLISNHVTFESQQSMIHSAKNVFVNLLRATKI